MKKNRKEYLTKQKARTTKNKTTIANIDQKIKNLEHEKLLHTFLGSKPLDGQNSTHACMKIVFYIGIIMCITFLTLEPTNIEIFRETILFVLATQIAGVAVFSFLANKSYYREAELRKLKQQKLEYETRQNQNTNKKTIQINQNKNQKTNQSNQKSDNMTNHQKIAELKEIKEQLLLENTKGYTKPKQFIKIPKK